MRMPRNKYGLAINIRRMNNVGFERFSHIYKFMNARMTERGGISRVSTDWCWWRLPLQFLLYFGLAVVRIVFGHVKRLQPIEHWIDLFSYAIRERVIADHVRIFGPRHVHLNYMSFSEICSEQSSKRNQWVIVGFRNRVECNEWSTCEMSFELHSPWPNLRIWTMHKQFRRIHAMCLSIAQLARSNECNW